MCFLNGQVYCNYVFVRPLAAYHLHLDLYSGDQTSGCITSFTV